MVLFYQMIICSSFLFIIIGQKHLYKQDCITQSDEWIGEHWYPIQPFIDNVPTGLHRWLNSNRQQCSDNHWENLAHHMWRPQMIELGIDLPRQIF